MVAAAGEYYDRTNISVEDVTKPEFQKWLDELMSSLTDVSGASAYTAEDFALFGYSAGDGGQLLESDLLNSMEGIRNQPRSHNAVAAAVAQGRADWGMTIAPVAHAAGLGFIPFAEEHYDFALVTARKQRLAVQAGLRPVINEVNVTEGENLFTQWQSQGVEAVVPRTTRMASPSRDVLLALLRWFDLNVGK